MLEIIFVAIWFFLPAGAANVTPIFAAKIPGLRKLNYPIDCYKTWRGIRLLGDHKTWRGLIVGVVAATLVLWLQQILVAEAGWLHQLTRVIDYAGLPTLIVGPLFGLGALGGDAIESFLKRQRGVPPGQAWFPFDQTDYIIGGALATMPFVRLSFFHYVWVTVIWFGVHLAASYAGYLLGLKDEPI
jgi:CDP-2,3-bis-(O-geranylgeranyl)-sn-glycerol synthase